MKTLISLLKRESFNRRKYFSLFHFSLKRIRTSWLAQRRWSSRLNQTGTLMHIMIKYVILILMEINTRLLALNISRRRSSWFIHLMWGFGKEAMEWSSIISCFDWSYLMVIWYSITFVLTNMILFLMINLILLCFQLNG